MEQHKTLLSQPAIFTLFVLTVTLLSIASTFFLPALPAMTRALGISVKEGQYTVVCLLFGIAASQFISGYLSDICGRKAVLIVLFPIYSIGAFLCFFFHDIFMIFIGIFLQGFGAGGAYAVGFAAIKDHVAEGNVLQSIALISFFGGLSIPISTTISGYVVHHLSWDIVFLILGFYGAVLTLCCIGFPTGRIKPKVIKITKMFGAYLKLLSSKEYLKYTLVCAFVNSGLYIFYALSPSLIIGDFMYSPKEYGYMMFIPIFGLMVGRYFASIMSEHWDKDRLIFAGAICSVIGSILMLIFAELWLVGAYEIMFGMAVYSAGIGIISPSSSAGAMEVVKYIAGAAVALLSVVVYSFSALNNYIAAKYLSDYLGTCLVVVSVLAIVTCFVLGTPTGSTD